MKKYAVIDQTTGDWYEDIFDTKEKAINAAENEMAHFTAHDKKRRTYLAVMVGELDEDGCFDHNTAKEIKRYI